MTITADSGDINQEVCNVTFDPGAISVAVPRGESLMRAAARAEVFLSSPCGGAGSCGKCVVRISAGEVQSEPSPKISEEQWATGLRLACRSRVYSDVTVEIPESTQSWTMPSGDGQLSESLRGKYLETEASSVPARMPYLDPGVVRVVVTLAPPMADDRKSDLQRFIEALAEALGAEGLQVLVPLESVRELPGLLRQGDWVLSTTCEYGVQGWELTKIKAGEDRRDPLVAVIDLGTTTVWGELLDPASGTVLASSASFNRQMQFGEDVISRMVRAREQGGRARLQKAAADSMNEVLDALAAQAEVPAGTIEHVVISGNTTMSCLFLDVDTQYLRLDPYVPPIGMVPPMAASQLGTELHVANHAHIELLPCVASYVGGDIVAGVLASAMADDDELTLYLDIGTNGEAVVGNREWLLATSCSAGPAFEGGGIRHGMRATAGAIESMVLDPKTLSLNVMTIGDEPAVGICGSGVIDAVAELLRAGVVLPNGKFDAECGAAGLRCSEGVTEFVLVPAEYSGTGEDITLSEIDVENLLRAKAAMFAGVTTLLRTVDLDWGDLDRIVIAGAFGRHLRVDQAMTIGLLPEIDHAKLEFIGNGSLLGSRMVAFSRMMRKEAGRIASVMGSVEMSDNVMFHEEYMQALFLPHTDMSRFPAMERVLNAQRRRR